MTSRRRFIRNMSITGAALLVSGQVRAADPPMVDVKDSMAVTLKYVPDATKAKDPKYVAGSHCGNCVLYQGKAGAAAGPCPLFAGKQVAATGWCASYAKKAG